MPGCHCQPALPTLTALLTAQPLERAGTLTGIIRTNIPLGKRSTVSQTPNEMNPNPKDKDMMQLDYSGTFLLSPPGPPAPTTAGPPVFELLWL